MSTVEANVTPSARSTPCQFEGPMITMHNMGCKDRSLSTYM